MSLRWPVTLFTSSTGACDTCRVQHSRTGAGVRQGDGAVDLGALGSSTRGGQAPEQVCLWTRPCSAGAWRAWRGVARTHRADAEDGACPGRDLGAAGVSDGHRRQALRPCRSEQLVDHFVTLAAQCHLGLYSMCVGGGVGEEEGGMGGRTE